MVQQPSSEPPAREPSRDLPALYQDPWRRLADDLRAVVASLRLRIWELWRRNRQGQVRVPGFWPAELAPLFWPLLLAAALALLLTLSLRLAPLLAGSAGSGGSDETAGGAGEVAVSVPRAGSGSAAPGRDPGAAGASASIEEMLTAPASSEPAVSPPAALEPPPPAVAVQAPNAQKTAPSAQEQRTGPPPAQAGRAEPKRASGSAAAVPSQTPVSGEPPATAASSLQAAEPQPPVDPLRQALAANDAEGWIAGLDPDPARAALRLELRSGWGLQPLRRRQANAEAWQQQALACGYERLTLVDPQGRLLGRSALVGSGMILLNPVAGADESGS